MTTQDLIQYPDTLLSLSRYDIGANTLDVHGIEVTFKLAKYTIDPHKERVTLTRGERVQNEHEFCHKLLLSIVRDWYMNKFYTVALIIYRYNQELSVSAPILEGRYVTPMDFYLDIGSESAYFKYNPFLKIWLCSVDIDEASALAYRTIANTLDKLNSTIKPEFKTG